MRHGGGGRRAVPVLLAGRKPDDVARPDSSIGRGRAAGGLNSRPDHVKAETEGMLKRLRTGEQAGLDGFRP